MRMKTGRTWLAKMATSIGIGSLFLLAGAINANAAMEESFKVLEVGTHVYSNVTVTTRAKGYIFILHSEGMTNIRVEDLSPAIRHQLGYDLAAEKPPTSPTGAWAKKTIANLQTPQVQGIRNELKDFAEKLPVGNFKLPPLTTRLIAIAGAAVLLVYFFFCYCAMLVCQKTGAQPGVLIFIPVLQAVPMLRAAGMSAWWLMAFFVPVLNLVANVLWCVKIVQARQKSGWVALFLFLPLTNIFAFLYLAFSDAAASEPAAPKVPQIMTLETA